MRARLDAGALPWPLLQAGECIRATVLGASEYSVQLCGNTIFISEPGVLLPRKNLQVVPMPLALGEHIDPAKWRRRIARSSCAIDLAKARRTTRSLRWSGPPTYQRLAALAQGLLDALPRTLQSGRPLYFIVDGDIALTLGAIC